jgi:hypothetical protein
VQARFTQYGAVRIGRPRVAPWSRSTSGPASGRIGLTRNAVVENGVAAAPRIDPDMRDRPDPQPGPSPSRNGKERSMLGLRVARHDPWFDLEGRAARRLRLRKRLTTDVALALAVVACGLTSASWISMTGVLGVQPLA